MKFSKKELVLPTVGYQFYVLKEHYFKEYDDFQELEVLTVVWAGLFILELGSLSRTVVRAGLFILELGSLSRTVVWAGLKKFNQTQVKLYSWLGSLSQSGLNTEIPKDFFVLFSLIQWLTMTSPETPPVKKFAGHTHAATRKKPSASTSSTLKIC